MADQFERLTAALADRYTVERQLGQGGMATVYLAHDVKHDRKVAVKVLRPELAAVIGAERFLQEIKVTANLQHPHVLPLHDSGEADSVLYYVMPYVEGESLRERLNREKQLPVKESVEITRAVASALDYAHRHEVIHRDIKPENILLHDGQPVVSDFGIALAVSAAGGTRLTETGLSLGTPQYMSPEQAMGDRVVDARSDVYSLAAMLYEMLTGDPPYTGGTAQAIVAKVITEKAVPVTLRRDTVPRHVAAAIHKSLAKLPADRFPSASSFAEALVRPSLADTEELEALDAASKPGRPSSARQRPFGLIAVSVAFGVLALWGWLRAPPAAQPAPRRFVIAPPQLELDRAILYPPAISRDGSKLAFAVVRGPPESRGLYIRALEEFDVIRIPGTEGARFPFFSPDGEWIGFWADGALRKVSVDGGALLTIAETGSVSGASWGADDRIVFAGTVTGLRQVSAAGGTPEVLTKIDLDRNDIGHYAPEILPGGAAVLFTSQSGASTSHRIGLASMNTGEWQVLVEEGSAPHYSPTGHIVFARSDGSLWAVRFDLDRLRVSGEPVLVLDRNVRMARTNAFFAIAADGTLVFVPQGQAGPGSLVWVDHAGAGAVLSFPPQQYIHPRVSPDGRKVALTIQEPDEGREDIWVLDLERGTRTRLTVQSRLNRWPVWTHEGTRIVFVSTQGDSPFDLYWKPVDGSGDAQPLLVEERLMIPMSWAADQQTLAYYAMVGSSADIWTLPANGTPTAFMTSHFDERAPMFSPNGRWLAYVSDESGQNEVYVQPYPGPGDRLLISTDGGLEPVWSRDGRTLFYRNGVQMMAVSFNETGMPAPGTPSVLFTQPYAFSPIGRGNPNYDVAPDGRFLMVRNAQGTASTPPLHVVLNWFDELQARFGNE